MVVRTTLAIERPLLKKVKDVAFDNGLTQNEVIIKFVEYCVENEVEIKKEWKQF